LGNLFYNLPYDIAKMAEEEFLFLSDLDLAMHLTLEQRVKVRELFIEGKRYLNKVQDYLIESGFSKDEARSLSLKVSNTFVASEQGRTQHDWFTFLAAGSLLDGAARIGQATGFLKDLHANWKFNSVEKSKISSSVSKQTVISNKGNIFDSTPSINHSTTTSTSLKGKPNSSVDILDKNGNIVTRRWFDSNGDQVKDLHYTNHGNPRTHSEWPHIHGPYRH
jgi:hypothetical protein